MTSPAFSLGRLLPVDPGDRMRAVATGLLAAMALLWLAARLLEPRAPALEWVVAFAEAALVGGLADWFAVTALFRHPLGIPIPHTAIIPRKKDRIGDTLAAFLRENFLTAPVMARRLETVDVAGAAARWLTAPTGAGRLRQGLGRLAGQLLDALDTPVIAERLRGFATAKLTDVDLSSALGRLLDAALVDGRHRPLVDAAIEWMAEALAKQESMIREAVKERTTWLLRLAAVDDRVADEIIEAARRLLRDVSSDPDHPLRARIDDALTDFALDCRVDPRTRGRVEEVKQALLASDAVTGWLGGMWSQALAHVREATAAGGSTGLSSLLAELGHAVARDAKLAAALNLTARRAAVAMVADYGDGVTRLVSDTIRGWDARTVTDKVEAAVGRDLQYIRINGTLIGGLIGVVIHALSGVLG